jgi:uncharacterized protein DUF6918
MRPGVPHVTPRPPGALRPVNERYGSMASLTESLISDTKKAAVVDDTCALIDAEVADKGGISGLAIKAGYSAVKNIKPGFIRHAVEDMLPEFASVLDPLYQEAKTGGKPVAAHFSANAGRAADALLKITDGKVQHSKSGLVKGTYEKLRGQARKNVEAAVPRLGRLIEKHAG